MPERPPRRDDARPIPQQGRPDRRRPELDDEDDGVFTVDTRGRRRGSSSRAARPVRTEPSRRREPRERPERVERAGRPVPGDARDGRDPRRAAAGPRPDGRRPVPPSNDRGPRPLEDERPRRRRRWLLLVPVLLLAWVGYLVFAPLHAWGTVTRVDDAPAGDRPAETPGNTYLLVGSDSRDDLTPAERKALGTGTAEGRRTDSIMLVHVPSGGGKSVIISIPRDSYVPIPGHGSNKVNAAYSIGGPQLLVQTLEQVTGLRLDGYLEIGFGGFNDVVNSLGGVDICVPFDMDDEKAHINLKKGCQVLDGKNALGFVRARYSDPRGDIGRADRQRQFLAAIMKGAATPSTVLNPFRYWSFTHTAAGAVGVGQDTSIRDSANILLAMRGAGNDSTLSLTVPIQDTAYQTRAGISVKWDTERAKALFTMLREDQPLEAPPAGTDGKPSGG
ncbi:LCP family protein [Knoellia sp. LjRoot47]|uniref:LCP family protein n=1 Tax=Knoellia sp. LjRoot47 TaxID=3342330 RepID=UPI003ECE551D